jgi:YrbI family 3-deoxy-D-manno-octulosonate 8-phosphate phosphatase
MAFLDNMRLLKDNFPKAWQIITDLEPKIDRKLVRAATAKGSPNLKVGHAYLHEYENPTREAKELIAKFPNIRDYSDILFYGLGMGYQITAFAEKYPDIRFAVYEPVPEVFHRFLHLADLQRFPLHQLQDIFIESRPEDADEYCLGMMRRIRSSILIIDLPSYQSVFPEQRQTFLKHFENRLHDRQLSLTTTSTHQKRWTINSVKNLVHVLSTPDILLQHGGCFQNRPAILVSAGPSLEQEIENLKTIRKRGLAYIFSVGTAINALVTHGIYPHAACTYDPTEQNQIVCREVLDRKIGTIPLIFGSTVGYETLERYPGPKLHMLNSQDLLAMRYLKPDGDAAPARIEDAATIAAITLQLLCKLGCNPVILVGQNLAYLGRRQYAAGATYHPLEASAQELKGAVSVRDVYGTEVATNSSYIRMRQQIEMYLGRYRNTTVINTTKGGARIEGAPFRSLDEVIEEYLTNEQAAPEFWPQQQDCAYDLKHLMRQHSFMNEARQRMPRLLEQCLLNLDQIGKLAHCQDAVRIGQGYDQFNASMDALRDNPFMDTLVLPMNRVEFEFLILKAAEISRERNPGAKAKMMEQEFRPFLSHCEQDYQSLCPSFQELDESLQRFYNQQQLQKKAAAIRLLLVECDGVLTDGSFYVAASGEEFRRFHSGDRAGITILKASGINVLLCSHDIDQVITAAASRLGIEVVADSNRPGLLAELSASLGTAPREIAYVFNSARAPELIGQVGLSLAVSDAHRSVQDTADHILATPGGQGVLSEVARLISCTPHSSGRA